MEYTNKLNKIGLFLGGLLLIMVFLMPLVLRAINFKPALSIISSHRYSQPKEEPLMSGFEITEYNSGNKFFTLAAQKFYLRNKLMEPFGFRIALGKSTEMEGVTVTFYKDNAPIAYLNSGSAVMDMKKKNIIFQGRPTLITEEKRVLGADKISWDNSARRLLAEGGCFIGLDGLSRQTGKVQTDIELRNFTEEALK